MAPVKFETLTLSIKDVIMVITVALIVGIYHNKIDTLEKDVDRLRNDNTRVYEKIDHIYETLILKR